MPKSFNNLYDLAKVFTYSTEEVIVSKEINMITEQQKQDMIKRLVSLGMSKKKATKLVNETYK